MKTQTENAIDQAIPTLLRRVPSLRARDVDPLRQCLEEIASKIEGIGAPVVAPLTDAEISLIRESFRARVKNETATLPLV